MRRRRRRHLSSQDFLLRNLCFRDFNDLGCRYLHALFQTKGIRHLPIDIKLLTFGNLELLVRAVIHRQDYAQRRIDVPDLAGDGLCRCDESWVSWL